MSGLVEVGDRIVDNDPRTLVRRLVIIAIVGDKAKIQDELNGRIYRVQVRRIFTDGKVRRSGFNRIGSAS
jgi:hypothetical protein